MTCERQYTQQVIAEMQQIAKYAFVSIPLPSSQMVKVDDLFNATALVIAQAEDGGRLALMVQLFDAIRRQGVNVDDLGDCLAEAMAEG
jgi:hypothetical protein